MLCAIALFIASYSLGNTTLFLMLNTDLGTFADYFFRFFSYLGDGLLWVPLLICFIYKEGKRSLP